MNTIISLLKKKPKISGAIAILIIILIVSSYFYFSNGSNGTETLIVKKSDFIQTVSVAGKVVASQDVDLGFNQSGKISRITAKVGDIVKAGQLIAEIDSRDAALSLEESRVALQKLVKPAEKFDKITAENALQEAKDATLTANNDLIKAYSDGLSAVANSFVDFPTILEGLDNLLNNYNTSSYISSFSMSNYTARNYRDKASDSYWIAKRAYDINVSNYQKINRTTAASSTIEAIIKETYKTTQLIDQAVKDTNTAVKFVVDQNSYYSDRTTQMTTDLSNLAGWTSSVSSLYSNLGSTNSTLESSGRSIADKQETLTELINGADALDIRSQQLAVQQQENNYADYFIRAPFEGTVQINVRPGDSAGSGSSIGTFVTKQKIATISLNEVDIAKVKVGQKATLTFDAVEGLSIAGEVLETDIVGAVSQGVVTYNVKIGFDTQDERVRSGMSVSADIATEIKQDVLVVPSSAIKTQGSTNSVELVSDTNSVTEGSTGVILNETPTSKEVIMGLSDDTSVEIISGLKEGDKIITKTITPSTSSSNAKTSSTLLGGKSATGGARSSSFGGGMPH